MMDPLVLASDALPVWSEELTQTCPMLFPFEARQLFFSCTAFGVSRAIAWIQEKVQSDQLIRRLFQHLNNLFQTLHVVLSCLFPHTLRL